MPNLGSKNIVEMDQHINVPQGKERGVEGCTVPFGRGHMIFGHDNFPACSFRMLLLVSQS